MSEERRTPKKGKYASRLTDCELVEIYFHASRFVVNCGFENEINWQRGRSLERLTESEFLAESAWVVLSSGMRESVIQGCFSFVSESFHFWEDAKVIREDAENCSRKALRHFGHRGKISAISSLVSYVADCGIDDLKSKLRVSGVEFLRNFAYMGPATAYHLAKNIGLPVVKPDRHLVRLSLAAGFDSPKSLCDQISNHTGERIDVIDSILWRYATLRQDYPLTFAAA